MIYELLKCINELLVSMNCVCFILHAHLGVCSLRVCTLLWFVLITLLQFYSSRACLSGLFLQFLSP